MSHVERLVNYLASRGGQSPEALLHAVQQANEQVRANAFSQTGAELGAALLEARAQVLAQAQRRR